MLKKISLNIGLLKESVLDYIDTHEFDWINYKGGLTNKQNNSIFDTNIKNNNEQKGYKKIRKYPIFALLIGGVICLGFSALFHLFHCLSSSHHEFLNRMDYAGISILVAGSCYPPYYYFFYCSCM